jgi:outer membrane receptor protein involved in Fe transport
MGKTSGFKFQAGRTRRARLLPCLAAGLAAAGGLSAQDVRDKEKADPKATGSATVTITAEATSVEVAKTPNPVLVIDAERLQTLGTPTLARTLELAMPGRLIGGVGNVSSLFINGARSQDNVVLLDGIRILSRDMGVDLSQISLSGIERVEVLSGAASTLYGSDAHGGVVSLFSAAPSSRGLSGFVAGHTDTLGLVRLDASVAYGWENSWLRAGADLKQTPLQFVTANPYRHSTGHIGYGLRIGEGSTLTINYRQMYRGEPLPNNWGYDPVTYEPGRAYDYERESATWQSMATASFKSAITPSLYGEINVGGMSQERYSATNYNLRATQERLSGNALAAWRQGKAGATVLADYYDEKYWTGDGKYNKDNAATGRHLAIAVEGSVDATPVLRLVASARQQWDDISAPLEGYDENWNTVIVGMQEASIGQLTWKVGANLLLPSGFRAYASAGTAFNAPSLFAISNNVGQHMPEPSNEKSTSILAGVGYEKPGWWVRADASRIAYSDFLDWVYIDPDSGSWNGYYVNRGDIRVQGLELSGGVRGEGYNAGLFVRSQEGRNMELPKEVQLSWFENRPFFAAGLNADYALGKAVALGLSVAYIGHRYVYHGDLGGGYAEKTTYTDASLYAIWRPAKNLAVTIRGERLLQDGVSREDWENYKDLGRYQDEDGQYIYPGRDNVALVPGYPSPGRTLALEVRYKF